MNHFVRQLWRELYKLFARKRTYLSFITIIAVECVLLLVLKRPQSRADFQHLLAARGLAFDHYYSGLTIGLQTVIWISLILGSLFAALVSGEIMAKEIEDGTLRTLLCRPISRTRIITLKYGVCLIYTFSLSLFLGLTSLGAGTLYCGTGALFASSSTEQLFTTFETPTAFARYGIAMLFLALSLTSVSSLAFVFSCLKTKPATATITALAIVFVDSTFRRVPFFNALYPLLLSTHLNAWQHSFAAKIPWRRLSQDYAFVLSVDVICFLFALLIFQRRDFKT